MKATCKPSCTGLCGCNLCAWCNRQCSWCRNGTRPPTYNHATTEPEGLHAIESAAEKLFT